MYIVSHILMYMSVVLRLSLAVFVLKIILNKQKLSSNYHLINTV